VTAAAFTKTHSSRNHSPHRNQVLFVFTGFQTLIFVSPFTSPRISLESHWHENRLCRSSWFSCSPSSR